MKVSVAVAVTTTSPARMAPERGPSNSSSGSVLSTWKTTVASVTRPEPSVETAFRV